MAGWMMIALAFAGQAAAVDLSAADLKIARSQPCGPRFQPMAVRMDELRPRALQRAQPGLKREAPRRPIPAQPCYRLAAA
ncbi:hypothetical protein [Sphingomonas jatrophae]|uniref:Uncharacterized protein n=1 Tax=Sphingomonas jatrophae TaxID=1166337 RepID=A0A1I6K3B8_9SPHN|nr:hypothetical protein [Sphingomonas jatrophae]SFR85687.1 hypothetical protein SAMN05192580_1283 [Sphingomonas jatrophae]